MMLFLSSDISSNSFKVRLAHRCDEVVVLPLKFGFCETCLIYPMRGLTLDQLHQQLQRLVRSKRNQAVNMLKIAIEEIYVDVLFSCVLADVIEHLGSNAVLQVRKTALSGPNKMQ